MEDPVPAQLQEGFRLVRQHTTTPIAVGEVFSSIHDCRLLIEEHLIDYVRASVVHAGGLTHLRKIAALAELHHVRTGCHGATDLSPVCMAAALHFGLAVHNFGIQEHMPHTTDTDAVFPHAYTFSDGTLHPGEAPGLGVDIDETLAAKHPYEPAYLPTNRLLDGTVHDW
jgi:mannonate dehydratase